MLTLSIVDEYDNFCEILSSYSIIEVISYYRATPDYESCNTIEVKSVGNLPKTLFAWAFTKNSPTWKIVNYFIFQLNEAGALNALRSKWEPRPQVCPSLAGSPVNWSMSISAFVLLLGGLVLALIVMIIEHGTKIIKG